jgi:hypothetical protein
MTERVLELSGPSARPSWRLALMDAVVVVGLSVLAASPLVDVFVGPRWVMALVGGLIVGFAVAGVAARLHLGPWLQTLLLAVTYLVVGSALAVPQWSVGGIVPTATSLRALIVDFVHVWRDSLTAASPLPTDGSMLLLPLILGVLTATATASFLWRSRWPQLAALVVVVLFCLAAAFGDSGAHAVLGRGLGLCVACVTWVRFRAMRAVRANWVRRVVMASAVIVAASTAGSVAALIPHGNRDVLRDHVVPPLAVEEFSSPLSAYRAFTAENGGYGKRELFKVSPQPRYGQLLRLAVMDRYNGTVWTVGGDTADAGSASFVRAPIAGPSGRKYVISVVDYGTFRPGNFQNVWVPTAGVVTGSQQRTILRNPTTGSLLAIHDREVGVAAHDRFDLQAKLRPGIDLAPRGVTRDPHPRTHDCVARSLTTKIKAASAVRADAVVRPPSIPALVQVSRKWLQKAQPSDGATVLRLCEQLRTKGAWSSGGTTTVPSAPGHSIRRMEDFAKGPVGHPNEFIGDDEQYASALALMAQNLGYPARVVLGFVDDGDGQIHGRDTRAWAEVELALDGKPTWVPFFASATRNPRQVDTPDNKPAPQVLQPPKLPQTPEDADQNSPRSSSNRSGFDWAAIAGFIWGAVIVGSKTAVWTSPLWGILLLKFLRRRRRRTADDLTTRVSGGWRELTDAARDLGARLPASNTRFENSLELTERFPDSEVDRLGAIADRHVFGPIRPGEAEAAAYWADVETARKRMRKTVPFWRRWLAIFSPASVPWRAGSDLLRERVFAFAQRMGRSRFGMRAGGIVNRVRTRLRARALRKLSATKKDLK